MPKVEMSIPKRLGIAGKDVIAAGIAAEGLRRITSGDYTIGGACLIVAGVLYFAQQYV